MPDQSHFPQQLMPKLDFLPAHNISARQFEVSQLRWSNLAEIYSDFLSWRDRLLPVAEQIANTLALCPTVHAVRRRVKNPNHLIEKIIRKSVERRRPYASLRDYRARLSDLIGVRALHITKHDWPPIHEFIRRTWKLQGRPIAFLSQRDAREVKTMFSSRKCKLSYMDGGYRSVHYQTAVPFTRDSKVLVELQIRTLFEEAWGEVSHRTGYPYKQNELMLSQGLFYLGQITGTADYLASIVDLLNQLQDALFRQASDARLREIEVRLNGLAASLQEQRPDLIQALFAGGLEISNSKVRAALRSGAALNRLPQPRFLERRIRR